MEGSSLVRGLPQLCTRYVQREHKRYEVHRGSCLQSEVEGCPVFRHWDWKGETQKAGGPPQIPLPPSNLVYPSPSNVTESVYIRGDGSGGKGSEPPRQTRGRTVVTTETCVDGG